MQSPATPKYELSLASSSIGPVLGNFGALIDYPYGCTEQTMSKLVPSIVAKQLQMKLHQPISKDDSAPFEEAYEQSMQKMIDYTTMMAAGAGRRTTPATCT